MQGYSHVRPELCRQRRLVAMNAAGSIKMLKSTGPKMLPSDTPKLMGRVGETTLKYLVRCVSPCRLEENHRTE